MKQLIAASALVGILAQAGTVQTSGDPNNPIQVAINRGEHIKNEWKVLSDLGRKQKLNFGSFSLLLRATILKPEDLIAFDVAERKRRRMPISIDTERQSFPVNRIRVMLEANSGGAFSSSVKYRSSEAHVILTVNGQQIQPLSIDAGNSYVPAEGFGGDFQTYFTFEIPDEIRSASLSVIGEDGKMKTKAINPALLR